MTYNEIKALNDLASSLLCYFRGDWTHLDLMLHLKDDMDLPSEVLEHVESICPSKAELACYREQMEKEYNDSSISMI